MAASSVDTDSKAYYHGIIRERLRTVGFDVLRRARYDPTRRFVLDARDAWSVRGTLAGWEPLPEGRVVLVGRPGQLAKLECPRGWEGKRVLALGRTEYNVARAIAHGYRMEDRVTITPLDPVRWAFPNQLSQALVDHDLAVIFLVPGSRILGVLDQNDLEVSGLGDIDEDRLRVFYPWIRTATVDLALVVADAARVRASETILENGRTTAGTVLVTRHYLGRGGAAGREGFATQPREYHYGQPDYVTDLRDEGYRCFGTIGRDYYECVAPRTHGGDTKPPGIWDKPCAGDDECPFWDPARGEGGCDGGSGYCAMPVGVKGLSYRAYYADDAYHRPFCDCAGRKTDGCCSARSPQGGGFRFARDGILATPARFSGDADGEDI